MSDNNKKIDKWLISKKKLWNNCKFIKNIFSDISLLYKNIIHWTISKLIIFVWSILLGILSIVPFIIIFIIYSIFWDVSVDMLFSWLFWWPLMNNLFWNILLVIVLLIFIIIFSYSNFLLIKVSNWYLKWDKLDFKKNDYFNFKKIFKFFNISILNLLILIIPLIIFAVSIIVLFFLSGWSESVQWLAFSWELNYFVVMSFWFMVLSTILFLYLSYKIIFSYLILADSKKFDYKRSAFSYIKESFILTKWLKKIFKFILVSLIFIIAILPINYISNILDNNKMYLLDYSTYINSSEEDKANLVSNNPNRFSQLEIEFKWLWIDDINSKLQYTNLYILLFTIFNFIFIYWLYVMVLASFYKRELK